MSAAGPTLRSQLRTDLATFAETLPEGLSLSVAADAELTQVASRSITTLTATVGWKTFETLGRCGPFTLERHMLVVTLQRAEPKAEGTATDHATAEAVRDYLRTWTADTDAGPVRCLAVTGPDPIDRDKLAAPGRVEIIINADCDILRDMRTEEPTPDEPDSDYLLTAARLSAWDAITNWPALEESFTRTYQTDDDLAELQLRNPGADELPALALFWGPTSPEWQTNRTMTWPMELTAAVWLSGEKISRAEILAEELVNAIYRSAPEATVENPNPPTYIHAATGATPKRVGPIKLTSIDLDRTGQTRALRLDLTFVLRSASEPF